MIRPLLFSMAPATEVDSAADRAKTTDSAGFHGIEWTVPGDWREAAPVTAPPPCKALAGYCVQTDVDKALEEVAALIAMASAAGATCLNLTIPPLASDGFNRYQESLNYAHRLLHSVRHLAEPAGVAVALEAVSGGGLLSPVELRDIIDAANSWAVGACIDFGRVAEIGSCVDWVETLHSRVHSVRLSLPMPEARLAGDSGDEGCAIDPAAIVRAMECVPDDRPWIIRGGTDARAARARWDAFVAPIATTMEPS